MGCAKPRFRTGNHDSKQLGCTSNLKAASNKNSNTWKATSVQAIK